VHGFVESQGGDVFAESEEDKWTLVTIYLPATDMQVLEAAGEEKIPGGDERILLVDDEPSIARATAERLRRLGYAVTALTSGAEALALFDSGPDDFDLVFSDIAMPEMTGDKLASAILSIRPDIPVILITGFAKKMSKEKAMRVGAKAFLSKPVDKKELAKTVRNVLDGAGVR
jgi:CheY-like chemotaxis protein